MDLHPARTGIEDHRLVGRDDGIDLCNCGAIDHGVHLLDLVVVDYGIDCEIGFYACLVGNRNNLIQIVKGEIGRRRCTHIERTNAKIDRIGTRLDRCQQRLIRACRRHYFDI